MTTLTLLAALAACARADTFTATLNAGRQAVLKSYGEARIVRASLTDEESALLEALKDRNPNVRIQALKGLKGWVANSSASRERVLEVLADKWGQGAWVRREAARTLSAAVHDSRASSALLATAKDGNDASAVRAMAFKALYWQVQYDGSLRSEVLSAARRDGNPEARLAAIWALMYAGSDSEVRRELLSMALRDSNYSVRLAAARSLYAQVAHDSQVKRFAREAAERGAGEPRYVGIMMLAESVDSQDRDLLEGIARRDSDSEARRYAVTALQGWSVDLLHFFHLNHYTWRNGYAQLVSEAIDRE